MTGPSPETLAKARDLFNKGEPILAANAVKQINNYYKNADAVYLLALCHAVRNDYTEAERLFLEVTKITTPTEIIYGNIGLAQLHQGKVNEAIKSFLSAVNLNQKYYDAIKNLAIAYDHIQDRSNTKKYAGIANSLKNDDPDIINIMAKIALYDNNPHSSIALYNTSLRLNPQQPFIYTQLANVYVTVKQYDTAEQLLNKLVTLFPESCYSINSLAHYYEIRNRYNDSYKHYEKVINIHPDNTAAIAGKVRCLIALKEFERAGDLLNKSVIKHPDSPDLTAEQCNYFILMKAYEDAYEVSNKFITGIRTDIPVPANIALSHSTACRHTNRLAEAKALLLSVINNDNLTKEVLESLHYSLAEVLDLLKQYDDAFRHYKLANEILPRPSDITYYETVLTDIATTIDRAFLDSIPSSGNQSSLPVFIVGMPRSGTTLVEQILSSHTSVYGAGELTDLWSIGNTISGAMNLIDYTKKLETLEQSTLKMFSDNYIQKLLQVSGGEPRVTDKLPHNFMHIGIIEKLFPHAKIIHCQRHPFDTCLSIYFKKFNDNHVYTRNLEELAKFYLKYLELMENWYKNSALSILTVRYEEIIQNQESVSRKMISHLGLDWNDDVLRYFDSNRIIMTPSYHQASRPIYSDSVHRWKHYQKHINPLIDVLGNPEQYI